MKFFFTLFFLIFNLTFFSQSYTITYENSSYDTLTDYTSISLEEGFETGWAYDWERTFDFGFDFPFFGETQQQVIMDDDGYGYFPTNQGDDYNMSFFTADWMIADVWDTTYLYSDVRYAHTQNNDLDALVFEWHHVFLSDELTENGENHFVNYQIWFFENGVIEVRFGDIDLANCSYYFPGMGFSSDNENPEGNIYGPWLGINDDDFVDIAYFEGDHTNPNLVYTETDFVESVVTSIPNSGFVVRFSPINVSVDENVVTTSLFQLTQDQNQLIINGDLSQLLSYQLFDVNGKLILSGTNESFSTNNLPHQFVILVLETTQGSEVFRVVL